MKIFALVSVLSAVLYWDFLVSVLYAVLYGYLFSLFGNILERYPFQSRKKELLVIFQKVSKVIYEAFASLGTAIKLTNESIAKLEKCVCLLYEQSTKN